MNYEITQIKAIKEVAKAINKNTKNIRNNLNTLQFKGDKVYATDTFKAFKITTKKPLDNEAENNEHFVNTDIIIKPPLDGIHTSFNENFPEIESHLKVDAYNTQAYDVDYLIEILKTFKAGGAKAVIVEAPETGEHKVTKFKPYNKDDLKDLQDIEAVLMPLKHK